MRYARELYLKPDARSASNAYGPCPAANSSRAASNAASVSMISGTPAAGWSRGVGAGSSTSSVAAFSDTSSR